MLYELALSQIPLIGPVLAKNLLAYCGSAQSVFYTSYHKLQRVPGIGAKLAWNISTYNDFSRIEEELKFMQGNKIQAAFFSDERYPYRLKQIPDAPIAIYYKGALPSTSAPAIAIIGTRKCSLKAKEVTHQLINDMADFNPTIISGLAFGIDAQAHKSALQCNLQTIGVLGHGLDRIYPGQHVRLAESMVESGGGLFTEFMGGTAPDRENFPKRNRIVAGLVDAILVVESPVKGGSIITANLAFDYDREVMAIPGAIGDNRGKGCNWLIKQHKAHLVESIEDIMHLMHWEPEADKPSKREMPLQLSMEEELIFAALKDVEAQHIDQIQRDTKLNSGTLSMLLLELEFRKLVRALPGKRFELV